MRNLAKKPKAVILTHIVNPHQFYFKYINECVNDMWSRFDFEIQVYGNQLYAEKSYEKGYTPAENELVIFFNVIFNKWVRGRAISFGDEITLWCIDNGVMEKCTRQFILPLHTKFHENMNLIHLGGLFILPVEKKLNCDTLDIELNLSEKWDNGMLTTFKTIIKNSKSVAFTEQLELSNHKFGSLSIKSKNNKLIVVNQTFVDMNKAAHAHSSEDSKEDLSSFVNEDRLENLLNQSIHDDNGGTSACSSLSLDASQINTLENGKMNQSWENSAADVFDVENSPVREVSLSVLNSEGERRDEFDDSASISTLSSLTLTDKIKSSQSKTYERSSKATNVSNLENDYECNLRTCATIHNEKLRPPLQTSTNWINSLFKSTKESSTSPIIRLNEIRPRSKKSPSESPSNMLTTTTQKTLVYKERNNNQQTNCFDV